MICEVDRYACHMGKGNDPNCGLGDVTAMQAEDLTYITPAPVKLRWKELEQLRGQPQFGMPGEPLAGLDPEQRRRFLQDQGGDIYQTEGWRSLLDGYTCPRSGLSLRIPDLVPYDHSDQEGRMPGIRLCRGDTADLRIYADVMDGDTPIGDMGIAVVPGPDGYSELRIGTFELRHYLHGGQVRRGDEDYSRLGRGFATGVVGRIEAHARQTGVARMSVHAVGSGSYAWARMGFLFDPRCAEDEDSSQLTTKQLIQREAYYQLKAMEYCLGISGQRDGHITESQFQAWITSVNSQELALTPEGLTLYGSDITVTDHRTGRHMPIGQYAMAHGGDWNGVKFLLPRDRALRLNYPE